MSFAASETRIPAKGKSLLSRLISAFGLSGVLCAVVASGCNSSSEPGTEGITARPDIFLISIDTLRADHLGCYGKKDALTPNIDQLAANGAIFESAITTIPVTLPAHSSMLSGLIPPEHGVRDNGGDQLSDSVTTIAEVLKAQGYQTGAFIGAEPLKKDRGLSQGFDFYGDNIAGRDSGQGRLKNRVERSAEEVAADAASWILECNRNKPVFAFIHLFDPHWPYEKALPGSAQPSYSGEIAYVDRVIGQLLKSISEDRDESNRIVLLTSDHGEGLGEHGEKSHCIFVYNSTLRIPLIFHAPGMIDATRIPEPVSVIDIAPTLLELASVKGLEDADGVSLASAIEKGHAESRDLYFESHYGEIRFGWAPLKGIIRDNMKYIHAPRPELYDLANDPGELNNLFDEKDENSIVADLQQVLSNIGDGNRTTGVLDDEAIRKLADLGYVSAKPAGAGGQKNGADPKDRIEVYDQFQAAYQRFLSGAKQEALEIMDGLESAMSSSPQFFVERAFFQTEANEWEAAVSSYQRCLKLAPEYKGARMNLARAQIKTLNYSDAQKTLELVLAVEPENGIAHLYGGFCAKELGDNELAIEHWKQFVILAPDHPDAAKIRAVVGKPTPTERQR